MSTLNKIANFSRIDTVNKNYKSIGYAYSHPIIGHDFEADFEAEVFTTEEISSDVEGQLIDMAHNSTNCNDCNSRMRMLNIIKDIDSGSIHVVGSNCGESIEAFGTMASRGKDMSARAMKMAKKRNDKQTILNNNEGLAVALKAKHKIIESINENFDKYAKLSEKQIALVFKLAEQQARFDKINANAKPINFTSLDGAVLEVMSKKEVSNMYGDSIKVLLKSKEGWKVYGTLGVRSDDVEKGDTVTLKSNKVTASNDDKSFGFFSRGTIKKK